MSLDTSNIELTITVNPHYPNEPALHIRGVDTVEQVDTYTTDEVEELIDRLTTVVGEMCHKQRMMELNKAPTLWDSVD